MHLGGELAFNLHSVLYAFVLLFEMGAVFHCNDLYGMAAVGAAEWGLCTWVAEGSALFHYLFWRVQGRGMFC